MRRTPTRGFLRLLFAPAAFGLVASVVPGCGSSSASSTHASCGDEPLMCPAGWQASCGDGGSVCLPPVDSGAIESGPQETGAGEAGPTPEAGSKETGAGTETGTSQGGGLCFPCSSDSDCASDARCIYWGENDAYFCAPLCLNNTCAPGLDCGGDGEDIDKVHTYDVCYPPSNVCGDGGK